MESVVLTLTLDRLKHRFYGAPSLN